MRRFFLSAALAAGALGVTSGLAVAEVENSTSGHQRDRANWERAMTPAPHPHAHSIGAAERYTGSTEQHAREAAAKDAVRASPGVEASAPFDTAAPTVTNSGPARSDL